MIGGNQRDVCLVQRARQPASRRWEPLRRHWQLRRLCLRACHTNHDFPTSARESMSALSILTISSMSHSESKENGVACLKVYWTAARTKVYQFFTVPNREPVLLMQNSKPHASKINVPCVPTQREETARGRA